MTPDQIAERKAQLIALSDLHRLRLVHAALGVRQSVSPALGLFGIGGGSPWRSLAIKALGIAVPLLGATRTRGFVRVLAVSLGVVRAMRRAFR